MSAGVAGFDELMGRLRGGDEAAAAAVFSRFAGRLLRLAQANLERRLQAKFDAEDVLQSVFRSFFTRCRNGEFELEGWDGMAALLTVITLRKCGNRAAFYRADCRSLRREVALARDEDSWAELALLGREPTPAEAAALTDLVAELCTRLDERDRTILQLHLQGYSAPEIAQSVGRALRTVWRSLERIRALAFQLQVACAGEFPSVQGAT